MKAIFCCIYILMLLNNSIDILQTHLRLQKKPIQSVADKTQPNYVRVSVNHYLNYYTLPFQLYKTDTGFRIEF